MKNTYDIFKLYHLTGLKILSKLKQTQKEGGYAQEESH